MIGNLRKSESMILTRKQNCCTATYTDEKMTTSVRQASPDTVNRFSSKGSNMPTRSNEEEEFASQQSHTKYLTPSDKMLNRWMKKITKKPKVDLIDIAAETSTFKPHARQFAP